MKSKNHATSSDIFAISLKIIFELSISFNLSQIKLNYAMQPAVTFFSISSIETSITAQEFSNSIFGPIFNPSYIYIVFFFSFL